MVRVEGGNTLMAVLIEVENLVKTFGEFEILKGINFTLTRARYLES